MKMMIFEERLKIRPIVTKADKLCGKEVEEEEKIQWPSKRNNLKIKMTKLKIMKFEKRVEGG